MKPISRIMVLLILSIAGLYLTLVGLLGAVHGEPLGLLFMTMGTIALIMVTETYKGKI